MAQAFKPENVGHKAPKTASLLLALPLAAGLLPSKAGAETEKTATQAPVAAEQYNLVSRTQIIRGPVTSCYPPFGGKKTKCALLSYVMAGNSLFTITDATTGARLTEAKVTKVGPKGVTFELKGVGVINDISDTFTLNYDGTGTKVPESLESTYLNWSGWKVKRTADPQQAEVMLPKNFDAGPASRWAQKTETESIRAGVEITIPVPTDNSLSDRTTDVPLVAGIDDQGIGLTFPSQMVPGTESLSGAPVRIDFGQECTIMRGMSVLSLQAQRGKTPGTADLTVTEMEPMTGGSGSK
jgi:hypothetical protein